MRILVSSSVVAGKYMDEAGVKDSGDDDERVEDTE